MDAKDVFQSPWEGGDKKTDEYYQCVHNRDVNKRFLM